MIAIFSTQAEASSYSNKIHSYLVANRPGYNAIKWTAPYLTTDGLSWIVKEPIEEGVQKWPVPINTEAELSKATSIITDDSFSSLRITGMSFFILDKNENPISDGNDIYILDGQ